MYSSDETKTMISSWGVWRITYWNTFSTLHDQDSSGVSAEQSIKCTFASPKMKYQNNRLNTENR